MRTRKGSSRASWRRSRSSSTARLELSNSYTKNEVVDLVGKAFEVEKKVRMRFTVNDMIVNGDRVSVEVDRVCFALFTPQDTVYHTSYT